MQLVLLQQCYIALLIKMQRGDPVAEPLFIYDDLTWSAYETLLMGSKNANFVNDGQRIINLTGDFNKFKESNPSKKT